MDHCSDRTRCKIEGLVLSFSTIICVLVNWNTDDVSQIYPYKSKKNRVSNPTRFLFIPYKAYRKTATDKYPLS